MIRFSINKNLTETRAMLAVVSFLLAFSAPALSQEPTTETATVIRAIDGDTLRVRINDKYETVRLIGVNAPELKDERSQVRCFAQEAKAKADFLLSNYDVRLESDPSRSDRDRYGRLLRYVYLKNDLFNRWIIAKGYAYEYTYDQPYRYQKEFKAAQKSAEKDKWGLWDANACKQ